MKFYLDMLFCRTDNGLEVLGPPQRVMVSANWKTAGEQNASDGFHTLTPHRSLMEIGQFGSNAADIYSNAQIGRAACRERVCQTVYISVGGVALKKKYNTTNIKI